MKDQKKQIIVLCCLVAVVLGLGVFKVMGSDKPAGKPATKVEQNELSDPRETDVAEVDDPSLDLTEAIDPEQKARDPFVPQIVAQPQGTRKAGSPNRPTPLVAQASRLPLPVVTPFPTRPVDLSPGMRMNKEPEPDPASALRLTGIVEGSSNLAIIRGEEGARYIVREGQSIDGKYIVQSISRSGVRLRCGSRTYILTLGTAPQKK